MSLRKGLSWHTAQLIAFGAFVAVTVLVAMIACGERLLGRYIVRKCAQG